MKLKLPHKLHPYLVLLLAVLAIYWPVAFLSYGFKWDLIDVVLPFRYHFSECIQSGYFPFWNPYQQTGYPFYADLQAPVYYPELLLTSLITGYGVYVMHFLFILYTYLAAIGFYRLSYYFNKDKAASLIAGMAWAASGFLIGHGQHFFLLVSACWLPFVLHEFLRMNEKGRPLHAVRAAVFVFLLISGGYQAVSIVTFYLLLVLFIYFISIEVVANRWDVLWRKIKLNSIFAATVILLSLPLLLSTLEVMEHVARLEEGISLESTLRYSQPLNSLISFFLPFSTLKYPAFFGGINTSMLNHYFGIIMLALLIPALLRKRRTLEYILLVFGVLIMASAFREFSIRSILVEYVPLMDMFKYPAMLRLFGLLAFILIASNYFSEIKNRFDVERKRLLAAGIILSALLLGLIFYSLSKISIAESIGQVRGLHVPEILEQLSFHQHIAAQAIIQLIILIGFILIILRMKKHGFRARPFMVLIFIELFFAAQFNIFFTTASFDDKPYRMEHDLRLYPDHSPIPGNTPLILNDQQQASFPPFWRNTYIFRKQVSFDAFSSFKLKSYDVLDSRFTSLREKVLENPLVYLSDSLLPLDSVSPQKEADEINKTTLHLSSVDYAQLKHFPAKLDSSAQVSITGFSPNQIKLHVNTPAPVFLSLLQGHYPGWKAYIDEEEAPIITSNFHYQTIALQAGDHQIQFSFEHRIILITYIISNVLFFVLILFLLGYQIKQTYNGKRWYLLLPIGILGLILGLLNSHLSHEHPNQSIPDYYSEHWSVNEALQLKEIRAMQGSQEFIPLTSFSSDEVDREEGSLLVQGTIKAATLSGALIVSEVNGPDGMHSWHADKIDRWMERPGQWNDFVYFRNLYELKEGEEIKVFIWNKESLNIAFKNMSFGVFPLK